jgi:hypothetical protein
MTSSSKINLNCSDFPIEWIEEKYGTHRADHIRALELSYALLRGSNMTETEKAQVVDTIEKTERKVYSVKFFDQARLSLNICGVSDEIRDMVGDGKLDPLETLRCIARVTLNKGAETLLEIAMRETPGTQHMYSEFLEYEYECVNLITDKLLSILGGETPGCEPLYEFKQTPGHIYKNPPSSVFTSFDIIKANWSAIQNLYKDKSVPEWDEIKELIPEHPEYKFFRFWMLASKLVRQKVVSKVGKKLGIASTIERAIMHLLGNFVINPSVCHLKVFAIFRDEVIYEGDVLDIFEQDDPTHRYMRATLIQIVEHAPLGTIISANGELKMKCHNTRAISKAVIEQMSQP